MQQRQRSGRMPPRVLAPPHGQRRYSCLERARVNEFTHRATLTWMTLIIGLMAMTATASDTTEKGDDYDFTAYDAMLASGEMVRVGDMQLTQEQFEAMFGHTPAIRRVFKRVAVVNSALWPDAIIPYSFSHAIGDSYKSYIRASMVIWEHSTCVRFVESNRSADDSHLQIHLSPDTCGASLGYVPGRLRQLYITEDCVEVQEILLHELGHVLGLQHEHNHPDRDRHLIIAWNNINEDDRYNFRPLPGSLSSSYGIPYDPRSIMHYAADEGAICGGCLTIIPRDWRLLGVIGHVSTLSPCSDIASVNRMYCGVEADLSGCPHYGLDSETPGAAFPAS